MSNLAQRILSAVVLLPFLAVVIWLGGWWVAGAALVAALLGYHELQRMFEAGGYHPHAGGYALVAVLVGAAAVQVRWNIALLGPALTLTVIAPLGLVMARRDLAGALVNWALTVSGAVYVGWLISHFVLFRSLQQPLTATAPLSALAPHAGPIWLVWVFAIVMLSDSGAYFVGRAFGKHRMAPVISPKKSWEGAIGGVGFSMLGSVLVVLLFGLPLNVAIAAGLGAVGSIVGALGDLGESLIKRQVGVKDSGHLIPGHGGMLDRVDSLLFTVPVLYYCVLWLVR